MEDKQPFELTQEEACIFVLNRFNQKLSEVKYQIENVSSLGWHSDRYPVELEKIKVVLEEVDLAITRAMEARAVYMAKKGS